MTAVDAVATHHLNTFASGVARFNEILAEHLGVPLLGLEDEHLATVRAPLLSFKASELPPHLIDRLLHDLGGAGWAVHVFLHEWADTTLEHELIARAERVLCGNGEVLSAVHELRADAETAWTPGLLLDQRIFEPGRITVFSFGMAHKIRVREFARLRELLEATQHSYALHVSTANHETASIGDAQAVYDEMHEIFPRSLYFLGNLSDVAIYNALQTATFFAAFFPRGVRDNNTSVAAAMEQGCVVITNLDEHSPPAFRHMETVIDINQADRLPTDPLELRRIGVRAMDLARERGWDALTRHIQAARLGSR